MTPDAAAARRAEAAVWEATRAALRAARLTCAVPAHPAVKAVAHRAQESRGTAGEAEYAPPGLAEWLHRASSLPRHTAGSLWKVDLAEPDAHLRDAVARAWASLPLPEPTPATPPPVPVPVPVPEEGCTVSGWDADHRKVFVEAVERLAVAWPDMLDELRVGVTQIALLSGQGINGFTDFTVHGAVFVNAARLASRPGGLPGWVKLADALVHEGTHTRCNAAALVTEFLAPAAHAVAPVSTPLRPDPRPLTGLFQQTVVLVRQVMLYRRLLESLRDREGSDGALGQVLSRRHGKLVAGARQGVGTLDQHAAALTHDGRAVLTEARVLLDEEARHPIEVVPPPPRTPDSAPEAPAAAGRGV
ncbi:HEXXH motif-containing putative peptide modification protein [Streptomyces sp. NBC_00059]|uniref:aKG-HExxH-type peptide beta-hydroxylase n=1 Tax=Streptomyces sp. NBC_00059 TaxID=2975635 RepID=UPI0022536802|nr:HEXXH motif-containing putative peptide modification protein [Streptomyces sp. NBC_00059]MCX5415970.1 HEXXH motif-containing putative peptide modification protein [Streptomyces sp. NBC_00059]